MTYDRGTLEIMPPLPDHAIVTRFIDQIITVVCEELNIDLAGYRDTTWQRQAADRGLEADDCYFIQNAGVADERGAEIDIERDPPPDLAVETDITHSTVDKEAVYAALGVPELWRWDNGRLRIRLLERGGRYADASQSRALPMLPPDVVEEFVQRRRRGEGESKTKRAFRAWVRGNLVDPPDPRTGNP
jgi:Uma2 family endonuclease